MIKAQDALEWLKKAASPEDEGERKATMGSQRVIIDSNSEIPLLLAAFFSFGKTEGEFPDIPDLVPMSHWNLWLLSNKKPCPISQWILASGLPDAPHVRRAIDLLVRNKIVIADGTMSAAALQFLESRAR